MYLIYHCTRITAYLRMKWQCIVDLQLTVSLAVLRVVPHGKIPLTGRPYQAAIQKLQSGRRLYLCSITFPIDGFSSWQIQKANNGRTRLLTSKEGKSGQCAHIKRGNLHQWHGKVQLLKHRPRSRSHCGRTQVIGQLLHEDGNLPKHLHTTASFA